MPSPDRDVSTDVESQQQPLAYEPPRVESVVSADELDRESLYAGAVST